MWACAGARSDVMGASAATSTTVFRLAVSAPAIDNVYNGMKIWITAGLSTAAPPTATANPTGCTDGTWDLLITGGGCTGVVATWDVAANVVGTIAITTKGTGCYDVSAVRATAMPSTLGNRHGCTTLPTFSTAAVALDTTGGANNAVTTSLSSPKIISTYTGATKEVVLTSALGATPTTNNQYFISADGITE
jgi:hypothetical protein